MLPYILAAVGGYLIGQSRKDEQYADGGMVDYEKVEGTPYTLKIKVYYDKGGMNYFSGKAEKRGYYLSVSPVKRNVSTFNPNLVTEEYAAFSGVKELLLEVQRQSTKAEKQAEDIAKDRIPVLKEYIKSKIQKDEQFADGGIFDDEEEDFYIHCRGRNCDKTTRTDDTISERSDAYGISTGHYCDDCYDNNYPYRKDRYYDESYAGERMDDDYEDGGMTKGGIKKIKLYHHKTSGGAEYLCSEKVKGTKDEGDLKSDICVRIDSAKNHGGELKMGDKKTKLYHHKTSGGAEYLCSSKVKGTKDEGDLNSKICVRIDGAKKHGGELMIKQSIRAQQLKSEFLHEMQETIDKIKAEEKK